MTKSKAAVQDEVLQRARTRFHRVHAMARMERRQCMQDRRFYSIPGAQWEGPIGQQFENRPKFEINKVHLAVIRLVSEYRNNRYSPIFKSRNNAPGSSDDAADLATSMYRATEIESDAQEAYDNAFEEGSSGGMGAWRLRAAAVDDDDSEDAEQHILIEPIFDADVRVFYDDNCRRMDKKDARWCVVLTAYEKHSYEEQAEENGWDTDIASWPMDLVSREFDWVYQTQVFIAEYYEVEKVKVKYEKWQGLDGTTQLIEAEDLEEDPARRSVLKATGNRKVGEVIRKKPKIHKWIMNGAKILEDCGYVAGNRIPIVVYYGKRWVVDGIERMQGAVRLAKDPQRIKNMQVSKLGEISAASTVEKPIFTAEQMLGNKWMWEQDNIKNFPYLLINSLKDPATGQLLPPGPVAYTKSPPVPNALAALLELTEQDMQDILGRNKDAEKMVSNVSGDAVDMIQQDKDTPTFVYTDNFKRAMQMSGEIWLGMARDIYVEGGRKVKTVDAQMQSAMTKINVIGADKHTGEVRMMNSLMEADLDLAVDVGPSSRTRRQATVRQLLNMARVTPDQDVQSILTSLIMMNMEGEGLSDVRNYFRKQMIIRGVVRPTPEEERQLSAEQAGKPEDANSQFLRASAEQAQADAVNKRANVVLSLAKAGQVKAETMKAISEMGIGQEQHLVDMVERLTNPPTEPATAQPS